MKRRIIRFTSGMYQQSSIKCQLNQPVE
uniref:Uncharacterized protein n=1 Tax=Arundo donax TaxID=35708 RepID=A0A0A9CCT6_ARUDO